MDVTGENFFSSSGFSEDQHRNIGRSDLVADSLDLKHLAISGGECDFGRSNVILRFNGGVMLENFLDCPLKFAFVERLDEIIHRAETHRFNHGGHLVDTGQNEGRDTPPGAQDLFEYIQTA